MAPSYSKKEIKEGIENIGSDQAQMVPSTPRYDLPVVQQRNLYRLIDEYATWTPEARVLYFQTQSPRVEYPSLRNRGDSCNLLPIMASDLGV
jgi:hypothetical protein